MKKSSARQRILDTASRLFYEQGYNVTGINQIIEESDIARASLYNHFPSKRSLLSAYAKHAEEIWFAELDKFLSGIKDPKNKLLGLFDFRIKRAQRSKFGGCQFIKIGAEVGSDDMEAFELIRHQKDRFKDYIINILEQVKLNNKEILSKAMLADTFFLLLEGATVTTASYKKIDALKKAKEIATALLS